MAGPAHRSVSNIRPSVAGIQSHAGAPGSPHTPVRTISSNFGSPSSLRAEEDCVVIEVGSRFLRAGFAGDAFPKAVIRFGPEHQRRAGDYRKWQAGYESDWRKRLRWRKWGESHELWKLDLRDVDLGLVADKIERALREVFTKYLLIDSRPRRMVLVLPSALPLPLLSTILDTLFNNFQPPTISLMSAPVLATVAAGLRAALVVDIGWAETVVTSIYEYREVQSRRSIRATRLLTQEMLRVICTALKQKRQQQKDIASSRYETTYQDAISFEECEEIVVRLGWCKPSNEEPEFMDALEGLSPVREEEIETTLNSPDISNDGEDMISIPLSSSSPPTTLQLPFSVFAEPCERAFFADGVDTIELDDEELPLHMLIYRSLLHLPVDVRSVCIARIIFTGGGSNIAGLKSRIANEVCGLIQDRGWDPVRGKAVEQLQANIKKHLNRSRQSNGGPMEAPQIELNNPANTEDSRTAGHAAFEAQEADPIEEQIRREAQKGDRQTAQGTLRVVESLGAWGGGSLLSLFKIPAVSLVERELWLQHGVAGASKQGELPTSQRQSIGPSGLRAGLGDRSSWTLGPWG